MLRIDGGLFRLCSFGFLLDLGAKKKRFSEVVTDRRSFLGEDGIIWFKTIRA